MQYLTITITAGSSRGCSGYMAVLSVVHLEAAGRHRRVQRYHWPWLLVELRLQCAVITSLQFAGPKLGVPRINAKGSCDCARVLRWCVRHTVTEHVQLRRTSSWCSGRRFVMLCDARNGFTKTDFPTDVGVRLRWSECQGGASVAVFDLLHTSFGSSARRGAIGPGPEGSGSY